MRPAYLDNLKPCDDGKESWTVIHGANVLWHGIGQRSLVELPINLASDNQPERKFVRVEFESSGLVISKSPTEVFCFEVPDVAFSTQSDILSKHGEALLFDALKPTLSNTKMLDRVEVVGYADRRLTKGGNEALSTARADGVKLKLQQQFKINPTIVIAQGKGVLQPKVTCGDKLSRLEADECLAPNRRVEIRVFLHNKK